MATPEVENLFQFIKQFHDKERIHTVNDIKRDKLSVTLRPYQEDAVKWMIHREKYSHLEEQLIIEGENVKLPPGGIIADEMGLGKTIEVLACILNNPSEIETISPRQLKKRKKARKKKKKEYSTDEDETDEDEEEVTKKIKIEDTIEDVISTYKKPLSGSLNKEKYSMLRKWYEDSLSSLSPSTQSKKVVNMNTSNIKPQLRCYCTIIPDDDTTSSCYMCGNLLHLVCAGLNYEVEKSEFFCSECWTKREPIKSGATFIITPNSICQQWINEIENRIKGTKLKVLLYEGVKGNKYIQPFELANNDIVITTYQVLQSELFYTDVEGVPTRVLRFEKKFYTPKSPLPCVHWWRICLDEAQMVEGVSTKISIMARQLQATYRWAVTGTPVQKSINDLFGLIQFLQIEPYSASSAWNKLAENKEKLFNLLGHILWRNNKADVYHMLGVPEQTVINHWLSFSPIEGYFYQRMHRECTGKFRDRLLRLNDLNVSLKSVDRKVITQLMLPLIKLRQACIHPQAVRGRYIESGNRMITMDELMTQMISKAKVDVEGALRTVVACYNGKAALNIILERWTEAANHYREVLRFSEEFKELATVDTLQMIHTLYNLAEILIEHRESIPPTLRDEKLLDEASALEESFLQRYDKKLQTVRVDVAKITALVAKQSNGKTLGYTSWWEHVLKWNSDRTDLIERIQSDLDDNRVTGQVPLSSKLKSIPAVHKEISYWLATADSLRLNVINALRKLELVPKHELAIAASDCHLDSTKKKNKNFKYSCPLCCAESSLKKYEATIFCINKQNLKNNILDDIEDDMGTDNKVVAGLRDVKIHTTKKESNWKPAQQERILKVLSTYAKLKKFNPEWVEDSQNHLTLLETVRKEFKWLRYEWSTLVHTVSVRDELVMAKLRLRLPTEEEEMQCRNKKVSLGSFVVRSIEVDAQMSKFEWDATEALVILKKKAGILQYLQNLKKNGSVSQDTCPVCQESLSDKWCVMECGHCVCFQCIPTLLDMTSSGEVECPMCRMRSSKADLSYVVANKESINTVEDGNEIKVKGSYSSKVEAITLQLLKLRQADPDVKVLIFSTWEKVLDLLCGALESNEISYRRFSTAPKYKNGLQQFKTKPVTVLLLPLRLGGKGLNIVEATHIFLVEPILNPADELQAAGRIHRIGQTRPTFVHRFVITNTVEEKMISSLVGISSEKHITLKQLDDLF